MYLFRNIPIVFLLSFLPILFASKDLFQDRESKIRISSRKLRSNYYSSRFHQNRFIDPSKGTTTGKYKIIIQSTCSVETFSRIRNAYEYSVTEGFSQIKKEKKKERREKEGKKNPRYYYRTLAGPVARFSRRTPIERSGPKERKEEKEKEKEAVEPGYRVERP